jgi:hypothetical protein
MKLELSKLDLYVKVAKRDDPLSSVYCCCLVRSDYNFELKWLPVAVDLPTAVDCYLNVFFLQSARPFNFVMSFSRSPDCSLLGGWWNIADYDKSN